MDWFWVSLLRVRKPPCLSPRPIQTLRGAASPGGRWAAAPAPLRPSQPGIPKGRRHSESPTKQRERGMLSLQPELGEPPHDTRATKRHFLLTSLPNSCRYSRGPIVVFNGEGIPRKRAASPKASVSKPKGKQVDPSQRLLNQDLRSTQPEIPAATGASTLAPPQTSCTHPGRYLHRGDRRTETWRPAPLASRVTLGSGDAARAAARRVRSL